jgi:hypothetical protein
MATLIVIAAGVAGFVLVLSSLILLHRDTKRAWEYWDYYLVPHPRPEELRVLPFPQVGLMAKPVGGGVEPSASALAPENGTPAPSPLKKAS